MSYRSLLADYELLLVNEIQPQSQVAIDFADENAPAEPRPQTQFGKPAPASLDIYYPDKYELRSYQSELAIKAKQGKNTVICAPTGSGKTHVALDIIVSHLRRRKRMKEVARAVMFVPTIPLVNQQHNHLTMNTKPEFYVEKVSGAEKIASESGREIRQADMILAADIIVMTPQIFMYVFLIFFIIYISIF